MHGKTGTLYLIPTPIGNLEDISHRALRLLGEVDYIGAEDTRHTRKLLTHFGINTPLVSYYREKEEEKSEYLIKLLQDGKDVGLVSDAGTPAISDPGGVLVKKAHEHYIKIVPLPGPCALVTALSATGLSSTGFVFAGFPPAKSGQRQKFLASFANAVYPVIFYESPKRITDLLQDCLESFGNRQALWARELTKAYEDINYALLDELLKQSTSKQNRGEFVLVIWPGKAEQAAGETVEELLCWYRDNSSLSLKDVCKKISSDLGLSRSKIYKQALAIWEG